MEPDLAAFKSATTAIYVRAPIHQVDFDRAVDARRQLGADGGPVYRDAVTVGAKRGSVVRALLLADAGTNFQRLVVADLMVLGPGLSSVPAALAVLAERGVEIIILGEPAGRAAGLLEALPLLLGLRDRQRRQAVQRGVAQARARGVRFGRPRVDPSKLNRARAALAAGVGVRPSARAAGVSRRR
jgi:DNA invertase Pin-like site-specific DNA recombinase